MNSIIIVFFILLLSMFSCRHSTRIHDVVDNSDCLNIDVGSSLNRKQPEKTLIKGRFVPLETTGISIIGQIWKIKIFNGYYFIMDESVANALFVFDDKGRFVYKISSAGKGPGEILDMRDFDIANGKLYILDFQKVLSYDLNGNFLESKNMAWPAENICVSEDNNVYLFVNAHLSKGVFPDYQIIKTDLEFNFSDKYLPAIRKEMTLSNRFQKIDDRVFFVSPQYGEYDIYEIVADGLVCVYSFDFGTRNFDVDVREIKKTRNLIGETEKNNILRNVHISEDVLFFTFIAEKYLYTGFYFMDAGRCISGRFFTDFFIDEFHFPFVYTIDEGRLYFPIEANTILKNEKNDAYTEENKMYLELMNDLNETDNPIIASFDINKK